MVENLEGTYCATASASENALKVNSAVEAESTVVENVDPVDLVVTRSVEHRDLASVSKKGEKEIGKAKAYIASLDKVTTDQEVLLVG